MIARDEGGAVRKWSSLRKHNSCEGLVILEQEKGILEKLVRVTHNTLLASRFYDMLLTLEEAARRVFLNSSY